ncbi:MAG: hypothetical protein ACYS0F_14615 [Planctomycetota bacterium]
MSSRDLRRRLELHRPPRPSDAMPRRVLAAAVDAIRRDTRPSLGDRLWFSRPLRIGWAAVLILLVVTHVVVSGSTERRLRRLVDTPGVGGPSPAETVARELDLEPGGSMLHVPARRPVGPSVIPAGLD